MSNLYRITDSGYKVLIKQLEKERDEARALFDAAMEYADSAHVVRETVNRTFWIVAYDKPRPVKPW